MPTVNHQYAHNDAPLARILMGRSRLDAGDLMAIAIGGVLGATLRWLVSPTGVPAGWFPYPTNTFVTVGSNTVDQFEPVRSAQMIQAAAGIPVDTLMVNTLGCLLLGGFSLLLLRSLRRRRFFVGAATGLCGSLTTFSTFAVEIAVLIRGKRVLPPAFKDVDIAVLTVDPSPTTAALYLALSIVGGALAFALGRLVTRRVLDTAGVSRIGEPT